MSTNNQFTTTTTSTPQTPTTAGYRPKNKKVYILHVEDDEIDAVLTRKAIINQMAREMPGYLFNIDLATSLHDATKKVTLAHYDMVLLDLALADVEGLDNLRALKAQRPSLPIVVLTGRCDSNLAVEAVADGADDYIMKVQMGDPTFAKSIMRALACNEQQV